MEKVINNTNTTNNESLNLISRKNLTIEGIVEIIASSDSTILLKLKDTNLSITGNNINITKLDINTGILQAEGIFESIKYGKSGNIFKRIFKWKYPISYNLKILV